MTPNDFINLLSKAAVESMKTTGVPASFLIAQASLESSWGNSGLARYANNLFGIKADKAWKGDTLSLPTYEYVNGKLVKIMAKWRKYETIGDCLIDHTNFLHNNQRYAPAFKCDSGEDFASAVSAAGYATDPNYANKIISIIRSYKLAKLEV